MSSARQGASVPAIELAQVLEQELQAVLRVLDHAVRVVVVVGMTPRLIGYRRIDARDSLARGTDNQSTVRKQDTQERLYAQLR